MTAEPSLPLTHRAKCGALGPELPLGMTFTR